jgi:OOP family OmpA-OmpF porin
VAAAFLVALPGAALSLDIELPPGAEIVQSGPQVEGRFEIAEGPWQDGSVPTREVSGLVQRMTWQMPATDTATVDLVSARFESELAAQGFEILLSCRDRACGGFDFRHRLDMGQGPEMHVDIGDFRYVSAVRDDGSGAAAVTVSSGGDTLYVNAVHVGEGPARGAWVIPSNRAPELAGADGTATADETPLTSPPEVETGLVATLLAGGAAPLDDLGFRTGASELSGQGYASLSALAGFLAADADRRVILVGHTDSEGGREANIALSEARARSVRRYLIETLGVAPEQVEAAGIGFLAPRATNVTPEGREANRRVEVVLLDAG